MKDPFSTRQFIGRGGGTKNNIPPKVDPDYMPTTIYPKEQDEWHTGDGREGRFVVGKRREAHREQPRSARTGASRTAVSFTKLFLIPCSWEYALA